MTTIYASGFALKNLPKRADFDYYPTPYPVALDALSYMPRTLTPTCILDPGAGLGVWGQAARSLWPQACITGIDIRPLQRPAAYNFWFTNDFRLMDEARCFDLVVGNPPYKYAEPFVRHSLKMLEPGGYLIMLLRLNFLESKSRANGLWRDYPLFEVIVSAGRVSFTGDGRSNATAYAYFIWKQGYKGETVLKWSKAA